MASVNKVILVANLGRDPEIRSLNDGTQVANLSVATSESWNDKNTGEKREKTEWHRCVLWGKLAEIAGQYLHKGSKVYLEGQLETRKWTDQQGVEKYSTEVVLSGFNGKLVMLDGRQDDPAKEPRQYPSEEGPAGGGPGDDLSDEIPFAPETR